MTEGAPILPVPETAEKSEDKEGKKDKDKEKKKSRLAAIALEKEPERREREEKPKKESIWEKAEPVSEEKAPTEELAPEETKLIIRESAEDRLAALPELDDSADPEDAASELAAQEFLAEAAASGDADEALEKTAAKLEVSPADLAELTAEPEELETSVEEADEESPDEEIVFDRRAESEPDEEVTDEDEPEKPAKASPAMSPAPPARPPFGPISFGQVPGGGPNGPGFNAAPIPPESNKLNNEPQYHETSPAAMALFGGIIGYLIGRRRGRIKTEKKLIPIQKKLEKQVVNLQFELQEKEKKIRRIAAAKVRQEGPQIIETLKKDKKERAPDERREAPEAKILHIPKAPEHIGQVLIAGEAEPPIKAEKEIAKIEEAPERLTKPSIERRAETMNRNELLEISGKIVVEGSTLRQIYETHLVGERGLRRLVAEHLRGGDLKKALKREIVEREIDFERDPALRDMKPMDGASTAASTAGGGKAALDQMLAKAGANVGDNSEEAAYFKARAEYEAKEHGQQKQQRRIIDVSLALIITALLAAIVWLAFLRGQ